MQEELQHLLFGGQQQQQQQQQLQQQERHDNVTMLPRVRTKNTKQGKGGSPETIWILDTKQTKVKFQESLIDGDRVDFIDYDPEDYDLYR